jgi:hypothetical protein
MKWDAQKELTANLNRLRFWVEKTQWEQKDLPAGMKQVPVRYRRRWQSYAQDLGDRCQYNLGWHDAQQGVELEQFRSTVAINTELSQLVEVIERYGKPKQKRGNPKKTKLNQIDLSILGEWRNDPKRRPRTYFIEQAIDAGKLTDASLEWHIKRFRTAIKRAIEAGNLKPELARRAKKGAKK